MIKVNKRTAKLAYNYAADEIRAYGGTINLHKSRCLDCKYGLECKRLCIMQAEYKNLIVHAKALTIRAT